MAEHEAALSHFAASGGHIVREVVVTQPETLIPVSYLRETFDYGEGSERYGLYEGRFGVSNPQCPIEDLNIAIKADDLPNEAANLPRAPEPLPSNVSPSYPEPARRLNIETMARTRVWISAEGKVDRICFSSGHELFDESVTRALMSWRYRPAVWPNGEPIAVRRVVAIPFTLLGAP